MSADPQQFIKYPVGLLEWRRHLSGNEWAILSVIIDKTAGWDKETDAVSNSQIQEGTTLSKSTIKALLARMTGSESGPLEVLSHGVRGIPVYRVRTCDRVRIWPPTSPTGSESGPHGSESDPLAPLTGSESGRTTDEYLTSEPLAKLKQER
jgi:hypothetical protein